MKFWVLGCLIFMGSTFLYAQETMHDLLGLDMVDTSNYDGKILFYEEMPFNLLNKAEVDSKIDHDLHSHKNVHLRTLGDVNAYLVKNKITEYQKIRAIYRWICETIEFDIHSYTTQHTPPQHPLVIFQTKRAVSKGYADLFTILCQNNEIECRSLKGYSKDFDSKRENANYPNHYWNVVRIDGYWYLIDIPMCLGSIKDGVFVKKPSDTYFLAPPVEFIKSHLPIHASWQLMESHITKEQFFNVER